MGMGSLKFVVSEDVCLKIEEEKVLIESYRQLFIKMYNYDIVDSFIKVTKSDVLDKVKKNKFISKLAENYSRAIDALEAVRNNDNFLLFLIYNEDNELLGGGRLLKLEDNEGSVPDIAITDLPLDEMRNIWQNAVLFAESFFQNKGIDKMYLEIPLSEGALLGRASLMGFNESPEDIVTKETTRTYIVNKNLERIKNVESNLSRK